MIDIRTGDFRELSKQLADGSVDMILTDPPYTKQSLPLWDDLARISARVLKPDGFLVAYSGQMFLLNIMQRLNKYLTYDWQIIARHNGGWHSIWKKQVLNAWKPILVFKKGEGEGFNRGDWITDLVGGKKDKRYHKWGQPVSECAQLLEHYSYPGGLVLDPFIGGGTTAIACLQTGRDCVGYEVDRAVADVARARVASAQLPLFMPDIVAVQPGLGLGT